MVARRCVADKRAIYRRRSSKNFAGGEIGPIAWADQAAGLYPVEAAIEMGGDVGAGFGFYRERFGAEHAVAEFVAKFVNLQVIGAHALLHDFRSDADHVGVADLAALDDFDDGHAGAEFAGLRGHAQDADVGGFQGFENLWRSFADGARVKVLQEEGGRGGATVA